jgi:hypothetical protein
VYASTSVDSLDAVAAPPTAMHAVGDGHEIPVSPALTPLGTPRRWWGCARWSTHRRGQSTGAVTLLSPAQADRHARRSPVCEPLQAITDGVADTVSRALAAHEHAIALRIEFTYYIHLNATRGPARITPRLLPYRPSHHQK